MGPTEPIRGVDEAPSSACPTPSQEDASLSALGFGFALPIVCVLLDPGVLHAGIFGDAFVADESVAWYLLLALGLPILALTVFDKISGPLVAGALVGIATGSVLLGIALLPLTAAGLMFIVGLLGLTPFCTAYS